MEVVIKRGMNRAEIEKKIKKLENSPQRKKFNPDKYLGKINWKEEPMKIQKDLRDEWK